MLIICSELLEERVLLLRTLIYQEFKYLINFHLIFIYIKNGDLIIVKVIYHKKSIMTII